MYEEMEQLAEIHDKLVDLIQEADALVHSIAQDLDRDDIARRAEGYWIGAIRQALGDSAYRTHATTMSETVDELELALEEADNADEEVA